MLKVGISGKIASGKSEAEKILAKKGFLVFDLDKISHSLLENNEEIKKAVLQNFNTLNRKKLGEIVFNNPKEKVKLENIIYPKLKENVFSIFEKNRDEKIVFVSGALLFKSGFDKLFDKTIFIDSKDNIRLERLIKRNNFTIKEAKKRLNLQDNSKNADFIVENNGDIAELNQKIDEVLKQLRVF